jgi:hypothetical protein
VRLKTRLGNRLIRLGMKWSPQPTVSKTEIKQALGESTSAVVEAHLEAPRWTPEQHGNVIIAEPDIMKEFRRNREHM